MNHPDTSNRKSTNTFSLNKLHRTPRLDRDLQTHISCLPVPQGQTEIYKHTSAVSVPQGQAKIYKHTSAVSVPQCYVEIMYITMLVNKGQHDPGHQWSQKLVYNTLSVHPIKLQKLLVYITDSKRLQIYECKAY